jgi:hypothetical protein
MYFVLTADNGIFKAAKMAALKLMGGGNDD